MIFKTLGLLTILSVQVLTQVNQNQQTVNNIVDAIKQSGISSGINEQHLQKVLGSNSLKTGKATINVINIVPRKKAGGSNAGEGGLNKASNGMALKQDNGTGIGLNIANDAGNQNNGQNKNTVNTGINNVNNQNNQNNGKIALNPNLAKQISAIQKGNNSQKPNGQIQSNGTKPEKTLNSNNILNTNQNKSVQPIAQGGLTLLSDTSNKPEVVNIPYPNPLNPIQQLVQLVPPKTEAVINVLPAVSNLNIPSTQTQNKQANPFVNQIQSKVQTQPKTMCNTGQCQIDCGQNQSHTIHFTITKNGGKNISCSEIQPKQNSKQSSAKKSKKFFKGGFFKRSSKSNKSKKSPKAQTPAGPVIVKQTIITSDKQDEIGIERRYNRLNEK